MSCIDRTTFVRGHIPDCRGRQDAADDHENAPGATTVMVEHGFLLLGGAGTEVILFAAMWDAVRMRGVPRISL